LTLDDSASDPFSDRAEVPQMWGMPSETPYDLRFQFLGIPVRVHPMFWLVTALLRAGGVHLSLQEVAIWVACVFVSILVHEFGHGLMARAVGYPASIVLYGMGGLCYSQAERQGPWERLAVLICGPGAGFVLAALVFAGVIASGGSLSPLGSEVVGNLLFINIAWGVLNLFPIWPLDGGQMTGVVLTMLNRRRGMSWTHVISLVTAGVLALLSLTMLREMFMTLFFGLFAVMNYQQLQAQYERSKYGLDDNDDWWRR
jgi:Zn-dependent protease